MAVNAAPADVLSRNHQHQGGVEKPSSNNGVTAIDPYQLPTKQVIREAGEMMVQDESGKSITFDSIFKNDTDRQLVVFIRHFYCGHCEEYIRALSRSLPPSTLATTSPPTELTVIGCGQPVCIPDYRARTMSALGSEPFPIYSDVSRNLYSKLGMVSNLQMAEKNPEYLTKSTWWSVTSSLGNIISKGPKGLKGGAFSQNGGEFLFEGGELKWCHRMRNTGDHAEVAEIKDVLGIQ